jgi:hypothetical protein
MLRSGQEHDLYQNMGNIDVCTKVAAKSNRTTGDPGSSHITVQGVGKRPPFYILTFLLTTVSIFLTSHKLSHALKMALKGPHDNRPYIQALTLLSKGIKLNKIKTDTSLSKSVIYRLQKKAISCGYDPSKDQKILVTYVEDAPKVSRPKKCTLELEEVVIKTISKNSTTRELSTQKIADMLTPLVKGGISARSIHRILRH